MQVIPASCSANYMQYNFLIKLFNWLLFYIWKWNEDNSYQAAEKHKWPYMFFKLNIKAKPII